MKDKSFGNRLKKLRKNIDVTQRALCEKIGLKISAIQSHEAGQWPSRANLKKYIDFYGCNEAWLHTGEGHPFPEAEGTRVPVHETGPDSAGDRHPDPGVKSKEWRLVGQALRVLTSDTVYSRALEQNIEAFCQAVETHQRIDKPETDSKPISIKYTGNIPTGK